MSHDTLLHRLIRPTVRRLAATRLQPNHLTTLRIATGIGAASCFAAGGLLELRLGAGLFVLSALLDRADGELARQSGRFSRLGHWLDLASDCSCDALIFLGLAFGAWSGALRNLAPLLGVLAALGTVLLFWLLNLPDARPASSSPGSRRRPAARRAFDPDDLVLGVPLIVCTAGPDAALLLAGVLTPLAVIGVAISRRANQATLRLAPRATRRAGALQANAAVAGDPALRSDVTMPHG